MQNSLKYLKTIKYKKYTLYPFLNLIKNKLLIINTLIQRPVERKPLYTFGLSIIQPRCRIDLNASVDKVNGKNLEKYRGSQCIPSTGQMIPHNITIGRKLPMARYVAFLSLSTSVDITKPVKCVRD